MLASMPDSAPLYPRPTCVAYVRVSTNEQVQFGWSLDEQEHAIRAWATAQHLELVGVFRDAGRSGRSMQHRSGLLGMLELVHHRGVGVVVAKAQDRLARAVDHSIGLRRWIHRHGTDLLFLDGDIHLRAADEGSGINLGDDFIASLTAILAEEEIATLRRRILPNIARAARTGRKGGRIPLGYRRQPDGSIVVDRHDANLVHEAVRAMQAGKGASEIVRTWIASQVRDSRGQIVTFDRLRGALTNRFVLGEFHYRLPPDAVSADGASDIRIPSHHPAVLDPVTFDNVRVLLRSRSRSAVVADPQAQRSARRRQQRTSNRLPPSGDLLSSLRPPNRPVHGAVPPDMLRCGTCHGPMYASLMTVGGAGKRTRRAVYLCRYHKDLGVAFCAQPPVTTESVDQAVFTAVQRQLRAWSLAGDAGPTPVADAAARGNEVDTPSSGADLAQAEAQRDRLRTSLEQLGDRAPSVLRERLAAAEAEVTKLVTLVQRQSGARSEPSGPAWDFRRRPQATWDALDHAGRRQVLTPLLASVVVRGKAVVSVSVRNDQGVTESVPLAPPGDES